MKQLDGQLSMFDEPGRVEKMDRLDRMYREALDKLHVPLCGDPQKCRIDIKQFIKETDADPAQLAEKLRDYFGIAGFSLKGGMFNMEPSNCWIQAWKPWETMIIPWKSLAKEIIRLIKVGLW